MNESKIQAARNIIKKIICPMSPNRYSPDKSCLSLCFFTFFTSPILLSFFKNLFKQLIITPQNKLAFKKCLLKIIKFI